MSPKQLHRLAADYIPQLSEEGLLRLDMTLKVHRHILDHSLSSRIGFAPDAKAWTEVPPSYWYVSSQRIRWHNSLCDVLWRFRSMLFRPRYGRIGFILLPWLWAYELMAPLVEVVAWTTIVLAAVIGCLNLAPCAAHPRRRLCVDRAFVGHFDSAK